MGTLLPLTTLWNTFIFPRSFGEILRSQIIQVSLLFLSINKKMRVEEGRVEDERRRRKNERN